MAALNAARAERTAALARAQAAEAAAVRPDGAGPPDGDPGAPGDPVAAAADTGAAGPPAEGGGAAGLQAAQAAAEEALDRAQRQARGAPLPRRNLHVCFQVSGLSSLALPGGTSITWKHTRGAGML